MFRKCAQCGKLIEFNVDSTCGIIRYDDKFYHSLCFKALCNTKLMSRRCKKTKWEQALKSFNVIERDTITYLRDVTYKEQLNIHLLSNYNIIEVPKRFMMIVSELSIGKYKGKVCRPVKTKLLLDVWKWGQHNLDNIDKYNKNNNKGPTNDSDRLFYDLAILIKKIPDYIKQVNEDQLSTDKFNREADEYFSNIY